MDQTVTTFRDLLAPVPGLTPGEAQQRGRALLPELVRQSAFEWWTPGVLPNGTGRRLLLGVAVWNGYDLRLLDLLADRVAGRQPSGVSVAVFDTDSIGSSEEFDRIIPGIGIPYQTPVVGYWEGGELKDKAWGYEGRRLVARVFGLDEKLVHPPPIASPR